MRYRVIWAAAAEQALARIWLEAPLRKTVKSAAERIDAELGRSPYDIGESRDLGVRVAYVLPLAVWYEVSDDTSEVIVWRLQLVRPRTRGT